MNKTLPLFGFGSLTIDSLSHYINGKEYWYMNNADDGLFNINGYIRKYGQIVYIKPGDRSERKSNLEQILFDFSEDTTKDWTVKYERNMVKQSIKVRVTTQFYNRLIKDSAVIF